MDTNSRVRATGAAVIGARHLRAARNGQDAVAVWTGEGAGAGAIVVCDGCGSGASSEVGARLGAQIMARALARRLIAGASPHETTMWDEVRAELGALLGAMATAMGTDLEAVVHEHFLFTIVAAAVVGDAAAVWAIGDGAYAINGRTHVLGPFDDNQPPYLGYDLLGMPQPAHVERASAAGDGAIVVATDGVAELGLDAIAIEPSLAHPDALRRRLAVLARGTETIEWDTRRIARTPAPLQDDGAAAILAWRRPS